MNQGSSSELSNPSVAFIKAAWHKDIVENGYLGFIEEMDQRIGASSQVEVFEVPGAFEIPLLARDLAQTGQFSAIVGCGFVIDGGIYRHEYVADAVISGLMQAQLETGIPVLSVVLTPKSFNDSEEDHAFFLNHFKIKGQEAAQACLSILELRKTLADK